MKKGQWILYSVTVALFLASIVFVYNNYGLYDRPIAKVTGTTLVESEDQTDGFGNQDRLFTQFVEGVMKNGPHKGEAIKLSNTYSASKAFDHEYKPGEDLFVIVDKTAEAGKELTGSIHDVKRDKYVMIVFWIFLFVLLAVGKKQGLFAVVSLAVNAALLTYAIEINVRTNANLLLLAGILAILFTVISLLLVNGLNEKTYAAIAATLIGTIASLAITVIVMKLTKETGLHYEEMQFLTRPYKLVFIAGLFIGSLGAVMDVAITMSSSIFELWEKNNRISLQALKASALDIGRDIMGTMTSILFFAYISGSIPMLILYLKNGSPLGFTLSMNLSLELARALSGGIGIVLAIPIGLYVSLFFVQRKKARL